MILKKSKHPSIMISRIWNKITPYYKSQDVKTFVSVKNDTVTTICHNQYFSQKDKRVLEYVLSLAQLRKNLVINLNKKTLDEIITTQNKQCTSQNRQSIIESLLDTSKLKIKIMQSTNSQIKMDNTVMFDFITWDFVSQEVNIDFRPFVTFLVKNDHHKSKKKYLHNFKSSEMIWLDEFIQQEVQQKNRSNKEDHPYDFRYVKYSKMRLYEWFNIWDEYHLAHELFDKKTTKKINHKMSQLMSNLLKYSKDNKFELPAFKYDYHSGYYLVQDYNYIHQSTEREMLQEIIERLPDKE